MYQIRLNNGTILKDLVLNGTNFISKTEVTEDMFKGGLDKVYIDDLDENSTRTIDDAFLVQIHKFDENWWFVIAKKSENMKRDELIKKMSDRIEELEHELADDMLAMAETLLDIENNIEGVET